MDILTELTRQQIDALVACLREVKEAGQGEVKIVVHRGEVHFIRTETSIRVYEAPQPQPLADVG